MIHTDSQRSNITQSGMVGPVVVDIQGTTLTEQDKQVLVHPLVGGIILFSRNFESKDQLRSLTQSIKEIDPTLFISVDQEGGRVQRFKEEFTKIPAMGKLGRLYRQDAALSKQYAKELAWLLASELKEVDVDFSFAPVLDINYQKNSVIGDRAFSDDFNITIDLATHFIAGLNEAGMAAIGKHFPGHGFVTADSHIAIPKDRRTLQEIHQTDLQPFIQLKNRLQGLMPAHVIYTEIDSLPCGFSSKWIQGILQGEIGYSGVLFSDDLGMAGASVAGDSAARARAAQKAGVHFLLVCNDRNAVNQVLHDMETNGDVHLVPQELVNSLINIEPLPMLEQNLGSRIEKAKEIAIEVDRL